MITINGITSFVSARTKYLHVDGSANIKKIDVKKVETEDITLNWEPRPPAPTVSVIDVPGNLNGTYYYRITFVTPKGETDAGDISNPVSPKNQQVYITNIPIGSSKVIARKIYRTKANPLRPYEAHYLVAVINDNTTTTYIDNVPDDQLGPPAPVINTTGGRIFIGNTQIAVATQLPNLTAFGYNAGINTVAGLNTFIGIEAGYSNTEGYSNTAVGALALHSNTTGMGNVAIGPNALFSNIYGADNIAIGSRALYHNIDGYINTAIGVRALWSNTSGYNNIAIGFYSLYYNTTGFSNIAIGNASMENNVDGFNNIAIGIDALHENTSGIFNVAIGHASLYKNTTGIENVAIGEGALHNNITGEKNIAIGKHAGIYTADGSENTASSGSIYIGYGTRSASDNDVNEIVIGFEAVGLGSNSVVIGNDYVEKTVLKGNVGIGTTSPEEKLHVIGNIKIEGEIQNAIMNSLKNYEGITVTVTETDLTLKDEVWPSINRVSLIPMYIEYSANNPSGSGVTLTVVCRAVYTDETTTDLRTDQVNEGDTLSVSFTPEGLYRLLVDEKVLSRIQLLAYCSETPAEGYEPTVTLNRVVGLSM
ncbi:MAG: hypothetical protein ABIM44_04900 [candidate division WOR-3 bacterium]